jgi:hypothetical protein
VQDLVVLTLGADAGGLHGRRAYPGALGCARWRERAPVTECALVCNDRRMRLRTGER